MTTVLILSIVIGLASARATRLVVEDTIFDALRDEIMDHAPAGVVTILSCPWCVSAYTTAFLIGATRAVSSVPLPGLVWLAAWQVACTTYFVTARASEE